MSSVPCARTLRLRKRSSPWDVLRVAHQEQFPRCGNPFASALRTLVDHSDIGFDALAAVHIRSKTVPQLAVICLLPVDQGAGWSLAQYAKELHMSERFDNVSPKRRGLLCPAELDRRQFRDQAGRVRSRHA